jgi:hypothetical protein
MSTVERWSPMPTYTITVCGVERLDGEAPYVYVVHAPSYEKATWAAISAHTHYEANDVGVDLNSVSYDGPHVVAPLSYEGLPREDLTVFNTLTWGIRVERE